MEFTNIHVFSETLFFFLLVLENSTFDILCEDCKSVHILPQFFPHEFLHSHNILQVLFRFLRNYCDLFLKKNVFEALKNSTLSFLNTFLVNHAWNGFDIQISGDFVPASKRQFHFVGFLKFIVKFSTCERNLDIFCFFFWYLDPDQIYFV